MTSKTLTLEQALQQGIQQLQSAGQNESPRLDCELLLAHALGQNRTYLYTWPENALTPEQQQMFTQLLSQRAQGHPIAHLIGQKEFWGLLLNVTPDTLIPRSDTETLIECVLATFSNKYSAKNAQHCQNSQSCSTETGNLRFLDLGTGSGAIALALKTEFPYAEVIATDLSENALQVAQANAKALKLPVQFFHGSWFDALPENASKFNAICANPPYIDPDDPHLQQGDVRHEPLSALIAENRGLSDLQQIIENAPGHLLPEGWLFLEHGYDQQEAVQKLLRERGFSNVATQIDLQGNPRISYGQWRE